MLVSSSIKKISIGLGFTAWVVASLLLGQIVAAFIPYSQLFGVNAVAGTTIEIAAGYILALVIALGLPGLIMKRKLDLKTIGLARLPTWSDIFLSVASVLPYYLLAAGVTWLGISVFRVIDPSVGQQIPFESIVSRADYLLVFVAFVIMAPLAEELLFRGYMLGKLGAHMNGWVAVVVTAVVFGLLHLPGFTDGRVVWQWGATADTFTMGLAAGILRQLSGSIWAGVLLHAIKNAVAYYFLFINPLLPGGM